jgi:hypothetical protein
MEALLQMGIFLREHRAKFIGLPRDDTGRPANIEVRKLLAVDTELSVALAALIVVICMSVEHEARAEANVAFTGRS